MSHYGTVLATHVGVGSNAAVGTTIMGDTDGTAATRGVRMVNAVVIRRTRDEATENVHRITCYAHPLDL